MEYQYGVPEKYKMIDVKPARIYETLVSVVREAMPLNKRNTEEAMSGQSVSINDKEMLV